MRRLVLLLLLACGGPVELPNPDGGAPLAECDARWQWCQLPDGGTIGAP